MLCRMVSLELESAREILLTVADVAAHVHAVLEGDHDAVSGGEAGFGVGGGVGGGHGGGGAHGERRRLCDVV